MHTTLNHSSEFQSVAAEISGSADSTRVLTRWPDIARS
jgi:hypothetical protein